MQEEFADAKGAEGTDDANGGSSSLPANPAQVEEVTKLSFVAPKYEDDATLWFRQLEAKFEVARIRSQSSKYYLAFGNIPGVLLKPVVASLGDPATSATPYDDLKNTVLGRESLSSMQRIDSVLKDVIMGDRRPSEYYGHLKDLAKGNFSDEVIYNIWLMRIPISIKSTLIVLQNEPLKRRLQVADELGEMQAMCGPAMGTQISAVDNKDRFAEFKLEIMKEMRSMMENMLSRTSRSSSRDREVSRVRNNSRQRNRNSGRREFDFCWHHYKFGDKASKCSAATCQFDKIRKN
jgi:hypothetical protein